MKTMGPFDLGKHVKSSVDTLKEETARVTEMMRLPENQNLRGAKSFTMKHHGTVKRNK